MKKLVVSSVLAAVLSVNAQASDVSVVGTLPIIVENNISQSFQGNASAKPNVVVLQKVKLSQNAKKSIAKRAAQIKQHKYTANYALKDSYPEQLDLGMNGTPVLNQGMHGSCVTFANSGALNALFGQGDYVSELCSLALGVHLEENDDTGEYPSGWDGSWGPIVLKQFFKYGVVSIPNQKQYSCGGMKDYPVWSTKTSNAMDPEEYAGIGESIDSQYDWTPILDLNSAFSSGVDGDELIDNVKVELNNGNRVTFGVLLDVNYGSNGAVGSYKARNDTWMLTPEIEEDAENNDIQAGHEMIVIGYDDNAVVKSSRGVKNKGLFILRNSWGTFAGDHGNYYMTYDHFKLLTLEAQALKAK